MVGASKIQFTKHAIEKFDLLNRYGFEIKEKQVTETILHPDRLDKKSNQFLATKTIDRNHALRVVYENRKDFLVVIPFYPVRRDRYDL